jgi:hypothetical protein
MISARRHALVPAHALAVALAVAVAACGTAAPSGGGSVQPSAGASASTTAAPSAPTAPASDAVLSRDDGWRADIDLLLDARERIHPDPWYGMDRATWVAAADELKERIPTLDDDAALVELIRLAMLPTLTGRDGHTAIYPFVADSGTHAYPIQAWPFSDGLAITAARAPYENLVGSRIEAIAGMPIDEVVALVEPLAPRDNASTLRVRAPLYLRISELLHGLGIISEVGPATFTIVDQAGDRRDVEIEPIPIDDDVAWRNTPSGAQLPLGGPTSEPLWLRDAGEPLWWTYLDDSQTLYAQYSEVQSGVDRAGQEIRARVQEGDVDRVVLDLRRNGGGNNTTFSNLERMLRDDAVDRPGRFVIMTGPLTFSAAANFATDLEGDTDALFAGEDMGGSPNLFGDTRPVFLPQSGQTINVAARYWERSTPDDLRITIEPDLEVTMSSTDYLAGRDPVLDAVIDAFPPGP